MEHPGTSYKCIIDFMGIQESFEFGFASSIKDILPAVLERFNFTNPSINDFYFTTKHSQSRLASNFILNELTGLLYLYKIKGNILNKLLPKLEQKVESSSTPLVNETFKCAKLYEKSFQCIENICPSTPGDSIWSNAIGDGTLPYDSFADIYFYVRLLISDIIGACGINAVCVNELAFNGSLKPEYLVITNEKRLPIGFVLVKRPLNSNDHAENDLMLANDRLHGEMLHHLLEIREMYGQRDGLFGIVSTYNNWRVYWLPDSDSIADSSRIVKMDLDQINDLEIEYPNTIPISNYSGGLGGGRNSQYSHSSFNYSQCHSGSNSQYSQDNKEVLNHLVVHGSKVYNINSKELANVLFSVILKMHYSSRSKNIQLLHPDRLYIEMNKDSWNWVKINIEKLNYIVDIPLDKIKSVIILKELKGGAHGKVWLCCNEIGNVFVLKFSIEQNSTNARESLSKEAEMWQNGWNLNAHVGLFSGKWVLLIPFVLPANEKDWTNKEFVHEAIRSIGTLANKSIYHKDLEKRHVGKYYDSNLSIRVIFFDLAFCEVNHNTTLIRNKMIYKLFGQYSQQIHHIPQE